MESFELERYGFICTGSQELQFIRGGVSVACVENFWGYIQKAVDFIKEYHREIIDGFKRGWNKF